MASSLSLKRGRCESDSVSSARLSPVVVFSPGPGCTVSSEWMISWKEMLEDALDAVEVITVQQLYSSGELSRQYDAASYHGFCARMAARKYPGHPLVLAGRSLGSRLSCLVEAKEGVEVAAVICLGYPLEGMTGAVEDDEALMQVKAPIIFVQGSKDVFCPLGKLEAIRKKMNCYNELHVVDGGNHSFRIGKRHLLANQLTQDEVEMKAVGVIASFISSCLRGASLGRQVQQIQVASTLFPLNHHQNKDAGNTSSSLSPVVVFAPGSSAPSSSSWMFRWKVMLKNALDAIEVITFDYPYMIGEKKRAPPKAERLVRFHKDIVKQATEKYPGHPLILAGKAMGARVSCMVAGEVDVAASVVVCLGYPLKSLVRATLNDSLMQLLVPVMFVQGSNDVFCPFDMLQSVRQKLKCRSRLHVVDGGDHSLKISVEQKLEDGSTQHEADMDAVGTVASFVSSCLTHMKSQ
ncbi:unnamed protein product [Linum trigynum]|uniref:KANL3/Tex30 alpha/beta hydrolase-like domain-containing protein n=1 Tax=Linum trigynum TaxID=586398 RepID=A0AAV2DJB7_9ROSI